jgi:glycosyltransferase involved in cell wall biosynthesis
MRVLHVLPSLDQMSGGPLRAVLQLSLESQEFGLQSEILGLGGVDIPDCGLSRAAMHSVPTDTPKCYGYSRSLRPWLAKNLNRFDGVIMHGLWVYPNWATYLCCRNASKKYACFPHGMLDPWPVNGQGLIKRWKKRAYWHLRERKIFKDAESIFFTTNRERAVSNKTFNLPNRQRIVVPYGISELPNSPDGRPAHGGLELPSGRKAALFLGRVHPKKNVHFLVDTWGRATIPSEWHLIIAGPAEPPYLQHLKSMADSLPKGKNIHFVGPVSGADKAYLFQRCSWFLLPSEQENFGIAVLESISYGCPVVISDQVYLGDDLPQGSEVLGLGQQGWTEFLEKRMVDETWRAQRCAIDRELVKPKFAMRKVAKCWTDTLADVFAA